MCVFSYAAVTLTLDPVTLILDLDMDVLKTQLCIKNEVNFVGQCIQKLKAKQRTHRHYLLLST